MTGSESTSAALARVTAERDALQARLDAAHEALAIDEFDGDSCNTLESTIDYAVRQYLLMCDAEANACSENDRLRAELAKAHGTAGR